jgi:FkbM family methyltransferase
MDVRLQVRQLLRMCGHALVRTVHERLDVLEHQNIELRHQTASIAETHGALLQSSIHVVENLHRLQNELRLEQGVAGQRNHLLDDLHTQIAAIVESQRALQEVVARLERDVIALRARESPRLVCVETSDYESRNPETGLMAFLFSSLRSPKALDIGAHVGQVSESLLNAGYEVYAFEPNPPVFEKLIGRIGGREGFHPFNFAIGASEGDLPLHLVTDRSDSKRYVDETAFSSLVSRAMPEDLPFTGKVNVPVKSLASLHRAEIIPKDVDLVKIDTEGFDLEVVRGMGDYRYPVVVAEFWGKDTPFGGEGVPHTLESLVVEMRRRDYPYHIVMYRPYGQDQLSYYCNFGRSMPETCGNIFFFREFEVFDRAQRWCSAVIPQTYFKPALPR